MNNISLEKINSYLIFKLGEELFAAHVGKVLNILEMTRITKIPDTPEYVRGVINLRGNVLPVVDTRLKFNLPIIEDTVNTCIIVMEINIDDNQIQIGSIVDAVQEVLEIDEDMIKDPPSIGKRYRSEYITGMVEKDEQFVMILDMDKIFTEADIIQLQESAEEVDVPEEVAEEEIKNGQAKEN